MSPAARAARGGRPRRRGTGRTGGLRPAPDWRCVGKNSPLFAYGLRPQIHGRQATEGEKGTPVGSLWSLPEKTLTAGRGGFDCCGPHQKLMEEELDKSTDQEDRIKAVKRLPDVTAASTLRSGDMRIPLLDRKITEDVDEDEMLAVSGLLGTLVPAVGGAANAMVLAELLLSAKVGERLARARGAPSSWDRRHRQPTEAQAEMASDGLDEMYSDTECFFSKLSAS